MINQLQTSGLWHFYNI